MVVVCLSAYVRFNLSTSSVVSCYVPDPAQPKKSSRVFARALVGSLADCPIFTPSSVKRVAKRTSKKMENGRRAFTSSLLRLWFAREWRFLRWLW
jgi:hypothetical protein